MSMYLPTLVPKVKLFHRLDTLPTAPGLYYHVPIAWDASMDLVMPVFAKMNEIVAKALTATAHVPSYEKHDLGREFDTLFALLPHRSLTESDSNKIVAHGLNLIPRSHPFFAQMCLKGMNVLTPSGIEVPLTTVNVSMWISFLVILHNARNMGAERDALLIGVHKRIRALSTLLQDQRAIPAPICVENTDTTLTVSIPVKRNIGYAVTITWKPTGMEIDMVPCLKQGQEAVYGDVRQALINLVKNAPDEEPPKKNPHVADLGDGAFIVYDEIGAAAVHQQTQCYVNRSKVPCVVVIDSSAGTAGITYVPLDKIREALKD